MMTEQITRNVIQACLSIEERASELYGRMAEAIEEVPLREFWKEMKKQEDEHIEYWEGLRRLAEEQAFPQIMDDPAETLRELVRIPPKVDELWKLFVLSPSPSNAFLLSYRMEFFLLHPVFAAFFHFMESPIEGTNPAEEYDKHLHKFADELSSYGGASPELELLGETLQDMWRRNSELARQSANDALTGVLNRRGFFAALKPLSHLSQRNERPVAVMVADVDDFKAVNDRLGHHAGDEVLRRVATTVSAGVRASDLVGRYGGEEFVVFLSVVESGAAESIAEQIRESVRAATEQGGTPVTLSIGVAEGVLPRDVDAGLDELIRRADESMYAAKRGGKNMVVVNGPS